MNFWLKPHADDAPGPAAGGVAGGLDILTAAAESMRLVDNSNAAIVSLTESYDEWRRRFKAGTGQDAPPNPMFAPNQSAPGDGSIVNAQRDAFARFINEQAARFPAEAVRDWAQFDPGQHAEQMAREADGELATLMASRPGWDKYLPAFAGAAAGSLRDPIQLGTLALGGGPGAARTVLGRIVTTALTEAGVNAAAEAALQPQVQAWREQVGLDSGFDQALLNIGFAGALGGVFGAGGRGIAEAIQWRAGAPPELRGAVDAGDMLAMTMAQKPDAVAAPVFERLTARADALAQRGELPPQPVVLDELQVARIVDALAPDGDGIAPVPPAGTLELIRTGDTPDTAPTRPVLRFLAQRGGVDPSSPFGQELAAMGVTSRHMPGIFKRGSKLSTDNIPLDEARLDGIFRERADVDDGNGYVSPQALLDAASSEIARRGEAAGAADEARAHYERRGVDFDQEDEAILQRMADIDDVDRRYLALGANARTDTADLVRRALEHAGGPVPDPVIRAAVDLAREGEDLATAVDWAMSDFAKVSRSVPETDPELAVGSTAPAPDGLDDPAAIDAEGLDWAADIEALRELDPALAKSLDRDVIKSVELRAAMVKTVADCPF